MYYNAAVTHWLNVTPDLQIINPALTKQLSTSGGLAGSTLQNVGTSVVAGIFLRARFQA
jgi:carbohydrate-selective porin OprB